MAEKIKMLQNKKTLRLILILLMVALNIGCDQISKTIVRQKIDYNESISVIKDHFTLLKVENTGAFLSIGDDLPEFVRLALLSLFPIVVLGFSFYFLITQKDLPKLMQFGICCLIGGGIGNVYDRIAYGSVTDFMHIDFVLFSTGVFNLADISIMTGFAILFVYTFLKKPKLA